MTMPSVSVIIPTHNRSASLCRLLDALSNQTYHAERMEVLVMANACTDGTLDLVRQYQAPFALQLFERPDQGPAAARNHGASCATGWLLIFLDDDIEPTPGLVEAHVRAHRRQRGCAVIGYVPPVFQAQASLFHIALQGWWEEKFSAMREPGHRYTYQDMLSGNFSLEAELFARVGGFDPSFRSCFDDFELGIRLLQAGASLVFVEEALGYHHETKTLDGLIRRKYHEAIADTMLGRRYPELRPTLKMARLNAVRSRSYRLMRTCAFRYRAVGDLLASGSRFILHLLAWANLRRRWRRLLYRLMDYWYWRGIAAELGTQHAMTSFLEGYPATVSEGEAEVELDLLKGLAMAEQALDDRRPQGAYIRYGRSLVGHIRPQPGAERLCGAHLRPALARDFAWPLLTSLALEGATGTGIGTPSARATEAEKRSAKPKIEAHWRMETK